MFDSAHALGVSQSLLAHSADRDLNAVVLADFEGRGRKRFVGSKVRQGSLQRQRIVVLFDLGAAAERPDLASASAHTQALL